MGFRPARLWELHFHRNEMTGEHHITTPPKRLMFKTNILFCSRSIRRPTFPMQPDLINSANRQTHNILDESKTEPKSGIKTERYQRRDMYTSCSPSTNCPPHIHRHDGEFGRDRYLSSSNQVRKMRRRQPVYAHDFNCRFCLLSCCFFVVYR